MAILVISSFYLVEKTVTYFNSSRLYFIHGFLVFFSRAINSFTLNYLFPYSIVILDIARRDGSVK